MTIFNYMVKIKSPDTTFTVLLICTNTNTLALKAVFLSTHIQVIWNDDPQLEVNSKFFSLLLKEIYTLKKKKHSSEKSKKKLFSFKEKLLIFQFFPAPVFTPFPLRFVWIFPQLPG